MTALISLAAIGTWVLSREAPGPKAEGGVAGGERARAPSGALCAGEEAYSTGGRSALSPEHAAEAGDAARASTRELSLTLVDARTGTPIPDLACVAFTEGRPDAILVEARSGSDGIVRLGGVPVGKTVVVETERREPYCHSLTALWPSPWNVGGAVLRVGIGGTLTGRVVDDVGAPIGGAEVRLAADQAGPLWGARQGKGGSTLVAQTDAEGRFQVNAVVSRPRGVWVVEGEPRPERFESVRVIAKYGGRSAEAEIALLEGESKTLPDLVFPRSARISGVVLDAVRRPVASALVSANSQRWWARKMGSSMHREENLLLPPGDPGFQVSFEEALSDGSGRFELSLQGRGDRARGMELLVVTPDGLVHLFPQPPVGPGDVVENHVLQLEDRLPFELELLRARDGRSIAEEGPFAELMRGERRGLRDGRGEECIFSLVTFEALWDDGAREKVKGPPHPDGAFRVSFQRRSAALSALEINAPGYLTRRVPVTTDGRVVCRLEQSPTYALELIVRREGTPPDLSWTKYLRACLLDEAELRDAELRNDPERCCGLGSTTELRGVGPLASNRLEVPTMGRYWLYVECEGELRVLGPHLPGGEPIVIHLPAAQAPGEGLARTPPIKPSAPPDNVACTVEIVNATTLEPIQEAWATVRTGWEEPGEGHGRVHSARSDASGVARLQRLPPGALRLRIGHSRYSPRELTLQVGAAAPSEPLRIPLDPLPTFALRIAYADGTPLPTKAHITAHSTTNADLACSVEEDGLLRVFAQPDGAGQDLGGPVAIEVGLEGPPDFGARGEQRRILPGLSAHEATACSLLPWREVEVLVDGRSPGAERAQLWLEMRGWAIPSELEANSLGEEFAADEAGARSFRFFLPAGTYRLRSLTGVAAIDDDLIVQATDSVQRFRVQAR